MSTLILIHGGGHGAWCWYKMVPRLEAAGHRVIAPDLPGHGVDRASLTGLTVFDYVARIEPILDTLDEPAILIPHSMGGMTASLLAERRPEKIAAVIYLTAIALSDGQTMFGDPGLASNMQEFLPSMIVDEENTTTTFSPEVSTQVFYGGCSADDIALAHTLLTPEPLGAMNTPIEVTAQRYGSVPRFGIRTLDDVIYPTAVQREHYEKQSLREVVTIPTAHSPFFSHPDLLAEKLQYFIGQVE